MQLAEVLEYEALCGVLDYKQDEDIGKTENYTDTSRMALSNVPETAYVVSGQPQPC